MAQTTCPTCNPAAMTAAMAACAAIGQQFLQSLAKLGSGTIAPAPAGVGVMIPGPGILRKFAGQAVLCPTCKGAGYIGATVPLPSQLSAVTGDGDSPNWQGRLIQMLPGP